MPSFAWHMHQGFTHTILLGLGIILTLHALLSLKENNSIGNYLYFGLALGIGLMSKYSFLLFMIPLLVSAVSISSFRGLIINQKIFLAIAIFILVVAPHAYWLTQHYQEFFSSIDQTLNITSDNLLLDRIKSAGRFAGAAIAFIAPFALIFIINSWRRLFNIDKQIVTNDLILLLNRFYLIIIVSVLILTFFVSMPHFKVRWFHPLIMILPLWMMTRIERQVLLSKSIVHWFLGTVVAFTIVIFSIRITQVTIGPELGNYGRLNRPIVETLNKLSDHLIKNSEIKTQDKFLGAHLLSIYQNNNIIINDVFYQNSVTRDNDRCLLLWDDDESFSKPSATQNQKSGELTTVIANTKYTLFYALRLKQECN
jgi:4-amino-4-deoxy-L-arabinose transferase-like glycosyltransferase